MSAANKRRAQDRRKAVQQRDAGKEVRKEEGMQERRNGGYVGFRADGMQNKRYSRQEGSQERRHAGKDGCRK